MRTLNGDEYEPGGEDNIPDTVLVDRLVQAADRSLRVMAAVPFVAATMGQACLENPGKPNPN
jgi:hypothetical protein